MKKLIATALLAAVSAGTAQAAYVLMYDDLTGEMKIDTQGGALYVYSVIGPGDFSVDDGFIQENHDLLPAPTGALPSAVTSLDDELSESNFNGWIDLPETSIGEVLPAGLTRSELQDQISVARYVDELGELGNPKAFQDFQVIFVPEPTSLLLLGGGVMLLARRRR